ncbi:cell adhesion molecule CEACAM18-like [Macrotis lagotis]|uniref:cell adhesion molecule CEACAM18-like n=1 Tax=Macrotis lagotis TaxID=92651 RepID=UPI003D68A226
MELFSDSLLRVSSHFKRLLLTVNLIVFTATAELILVPEELDKLEGNTLHWRIYGAPTGDVNYTWYRGSVSVESNMILSYTSSPPSWNLGPAYTGRENTTLQGFLSITVLELRDTGNYTVVVTNNEGSEETTGYLHVWEKLLQPEITVNQTIIVEYVDTVSFTCHPKNTGNFQIRWYLNYDLVSEGYQWTLSSDNRILTGWVKNLQSGPYFCEVSNPVTSARSNLLNLQIYYGPDSIVMSSSPLVILSTINARLGSRVDMYCKTVSQPPCLYQWLHNGTDLYTTTSTLTIHSMSWRYVGTYSCIAENPKTQVLLYSNVTLTAYEFPPHKSNPSFTLYQGHVILLSIGISLGLLTLIVAFIFYLISKR